MNLVSCAASDPFVGTGTWPTTTKHGGNTFTKRDQGNKLDNDWVLRLAYQACNR